MKSGERVYINRLEMEESLNSKSFRKQLGLQLEENENEEEDSGNIVSNSSKNTALGLRNKISKNDRSNSSVKDELRNFISKRAPRCRDLLYNITSTNDYIVEAGKLISESSNFISKVESDLYEGRLPAERAVNICTHPRSPLKKLEILLAMAEANDPASYRIIVKHLL